MRTTFPNLASLKPAALAALVMVLGLGSAAFAQEGEGGADAPAEAASEQPAAEEEAPASAAPADELPLNAQGLVPMGMNEEELNKAIAGYREASGSTREYSEVELSWISQGLPLDSLEEDSARNVYKGYQGVPTGDDNVVLVFRNQQPGDEPMVLRSGKSLGTPPAAQNVPPFMSSVDSGSFWLPKAGSSTAKDVDAMFNFIMWVCYIFTALIGVLMVVFVIKYRRRPGVRADQTITHNTPLEIFWSVVPTILVAIMFWGGYKTFLDLRTPPPDTFKIQTRAFQWGWEYTYPSGVVTNNEIHVPANTPIEMVMTSSDVLHSFHFPAFRQKSDVLPNRYTSVWFDSGEPGIYPVYCSEYCGQSHADMYTLVVVEPREDYEAWLAKEKIWHLEENGELRPLVDIGAEAYKRRGCSACHSIDGSKGLAPSFSGLYGRTRKFDQRLSKDGLKEDEVADGNYIRRSILQPHDQIVQGYGANMANYAGMPEWQLAGFVAYLESLKDGPRDADNDPWE